MEHQIIEREKTLNTQLQAIEQVQLLTYAMVKQEVQLTPKQQTQLVTVHQTGVNPDHLTITEIENLSDYINNTEEDYIETKIQILSDLITKARIGVKSTRFEDTLDSISGSEFTKLQVKRAAWEDGERPQHAFDFEQYFEDQQLDMDFPEYMYNILALEDDEEGLMEEGLIEEDYRYKYGFFTQADINTLSHFNRSTFTDSVTIHRNRNELLNYTEESNTEIDVFVKHWLVENAFGVRLLSLPNQLTKAAMLLHELENMVASFNLLGSADLSTQVKQARYSARWISEYYNRILGVNLQENLDTYGKQHPKTAAYFETLQAKLEQLDPNKRERLMKVMSDYLVPINNHVTDLEAIIIRIRMETGTYSGALTMN